MRPELPQYKNQMKQIKLQMNIPYKYRHETTNISKLNPEKHKKDNIS